VIVASRLRAGNANSIRGVGALLGDALSTATRCGAGTHGRGLVIVRADSGYYGQALVKVARRYRARFSVAARIDAAVAASISRIEEGAWTPIKYPNAIWNEADQQWDSAAEVAEIEYTAFTNRRVDHGVTARLIVRRVKRANPASVPAGQGELFAQYRHHAIFTDSPLSMLEAEANHRDHAIIEQVIADLKDGPLAHAPSGLFAANAAWLTLATIAFNLTRAAGALASVFHAKARGATIRAQLITVPARIARSARRVRVHLPTRWPWQHAWQTLHAAATGPPPTATTH
jgi:hypothetical protein